MIELLLVGCSFPLLRFTRPPLRRAPTPPARASVSPPLLRSLLSTSALLCSHPSSRLPSPQPPFSSVRFVLWLQRLNLLAKHTKLLSCRSTQVQQEARKRGVGGRSTRMFHPLLGLRMQCGSPRVQEGSAASAPPGRKSVLRISVDHHP